MKKQYFAFLRIYILCGWLGFFLPSFAQDNFQALTFYEQLETNTATKPNYEVFEKAYEGYAKLKVSQKLGDKDLLTVIDFSLSSNQKRLWVIDMKNAKIVHHTLVAHGRNSGNEFAKSFSNKVGSFQSSLGFYVTGKTYFGKHGLSLYLDGMEKGINDNARKRAIVMHGANYVHANFGKKHGRIGRSLGCPALPMAVHKEVIRLLADKTCLFIYYPKEAYFNNSQLISYAK